MKNDPKAHGSSSCPHSMVLGHALAAVLILADSLLGQGTPALKSFRFQVSKATATSMTPMHDAEVLMLQRHRIGESKVTILDRDSTDTSGFVELRAPIDTDTMNTSIMLVVLPTKDTAVAFESPFSLDRSLAPVPTPGRTLSALARRELRLKLKAPQGNPVAGAKVIKIVKEGESLDIHDFEVVPELNLNASDAQGELVIDYGSFGGESGIYISHPDFAVHYLDTKKFPLNELKWNAEITLEPGTPVTVSLKDLRRQKNNSPITIQLADRFFDLDPAQDIQVPIDFRNRSSVYCNVLLANSNEQARIDPITVNPTTKKISVTVFPTRSLQGFARDPKTKRPIHGRMVMAESQEEPSLVASSETQHDGYFRMQVPNLGGANRIKLLGADTFQPDFEATVETNSDLGIIELSGKMSAKKRLQIVSNDANTVPNVVIEHGEMYDSRLEVAIDDWIETKFREPVLIGFEAFSMTSKKSAWVQAGSVDVRSLEMQDELSLVGRLATPRGLGAAWCGTSLRSLDEQGPPKIMKNSNKPSNRPLLIVCHCASGPFDRFPVIDRLHYLRSVYSEEDLGIVLIYLLEPYNLPAIQSELEVRDCRFSVGIDRSCKTRETLPSGTTFFLPETNEVFCLPNLALRPIRDIMLYMRPSDSR